MSKMLTHNGTVYSPEHKHLIIIHKDWTTLCNGYSRKNTGQEVECIEIYKEMINEITPNFRHYPRQTEPPGMLL